jgi:hypothetical protein
MRRAFLLICCCSVLSGCGGKRMQSNSSFPSAKATRNPTNTTIVTPGGSLPGKVVSFNPNGRFAVLRFPLAEMPALEQRLGVFRGGLKVGELKVSGPQRDTLTIADLIAGECRAGDEVRAQ